MISATELESPTCYLRSKAIENFARCRPLFYAAVVDGVAGFGSVELSVRREAEMLLNFITEAKTTEATVAKRIRRRWRGCPPQVQKTAIPSAARRWISTKDGGQMLR